MRLQESIVWLNRFTPPLLKQHPAQTSVAMNRRSCAWSDDFLLQIVTSKGRQSALAVAE